MLNTYLLYYSEWEGCGCHGENDERLLVISATTEAEALGRALTIHSDTFAKQWDITKIDTTTPTAIDKYGDVIK